MKRNRNRAVTETERSRSISVSLRLMQTSTAYNLTNKPQPTNRYTNFCICFGL